MAVRGIIPGIRALFRRRQEDADLNEELRAYVDSATEENVARGMPRAAALRAARAELGSAEAVKDDVRDVGWESRLYSIGQDLRYAVRMLRKNPGFTAVAILSLALSMGANTAFFSLYDSVFLKELPVRDPGRLVVLGWSSGKTPMFRSLDGNERHDRGGVTSTSFPHLAYERMRALNQTLDSLFAFAPTEQLNVKAGGLAEIAKGQVVSGNYFTAVGAEAFVGRTLTPGDDSPGASAVAVLSHEYWQRRFGGDPSVLGTTITVNNVACTIIGVTRPDFVGTLDHEPIDMTLPLALEPQVRGSESELVEQSPVTWWLRVMGRRKPGVKLAEVQSNLEGAFREAAFETWKMGPMRTGEDKLTRDDAPRLSVADGSRGLTDARVDFLRPTIILMGIVGLVLLIACVNVANMMLAKAESRQREIAVRLAIGAGRARVARQLLTESVLLALLASGLGIALAYSARHLMPALVPWSEAIAIQLDWRVLGFTLAVALITGLIFGMAPAAHALRVGVGLALKEGAKSSTGRQGSAWGKALVVAQVALSLILLVAAGLFLRTLSNLNRVDLGFDARNLLLFRVDPRLSGYKPEQILPLYDRLAERLGAVPGVKAVTISRHPLLANSARIRLTEIPGHGSIPTYLNPVDTEFFATMNIPIVSGRAFTPRDDRTAPKVAVVNETAARKLLGTDNPIGRQMRLDRGPANSYEVVGVTRDAKYTDVRQQVPATVYTPLRQEAGGQVNFEVRTAAEPLALVAAVRAAVHEVDGNLPIFDVKTQVERADETIAQERTFAALSSSFGGLALLLAAIGLFGVMSYTVARRTSEIAIRLALGAKQHGVLLMVVRETLMMVIAGAAIGIPCALAAARLTQAALADVLYGIKATDPLTFVAAAVGLVGVGVIAAYVPARRAASVDPMVALRNE